MKVPLQGVLAVPHVEALVPHERVLADGEGVGLRGAPPDDLNDRRRVSKAGEEESSQFGFLKCFLFI